MFPAVRMQETNLSVFVLPAKHSGDDLTNLFLVCMTEIEPDVANDFQHLRSSL